jgi:hypothetical protein
MRSRIRSSVGAARFDLLHRQVANFQTHYHPAGNDVWGTRLSRDLPHRTYLPAGGGGHHPVDGHDQPRGRQQRVLPPVHRGGAGVVGKALEGHLPPFDADDPLDDANLDAVAVEHRPLLDVELEIDLDITKVSPGSVQTIRVATDIANPLTDGLATVADHLEGLLREVSDHRAAADQTALLVRKDHHLQRVTGDYIGFVQDLSTLDGGDDADITIVVAALGDRVDVRAKQDDRQIRFSARLATEDVSPLIHPHLQTGLSHERHDVLPTLEVGFTKSNARDPSLGVGPNTGKLLDPRLDPVGIDAQSIR